MTKVGIITLYYGNDNYGGIAQAYALNRYIQKLGYDSELISYKRSPSHIPGTREKIKKEGIGAFIKGKFEMLPEKIYVKITTKLAEKKYQDELKPYIEQRKEAFARSRELADHSDVVYTEDSISDCIGKYDVYVSGSDQIWKPGVLQSPYVFEFLPEGYKRFSYASSITVTELTDSYGAYMKKMLSNYSWISVREQSAKLYLEEITGRNVDVVVDPTLLLDEEDWNGITAQRVVQENYIFVYLLGENVKQRKIITKFAKKNNLKIVTLPHVEGKVRACDVGFGDIHLYDVDLPTFFSLIKYADYVCTDSFHAVVFSNVFETNFLAFERVILSKKANMNSRMDTLLKMLSEEEKFILKNNGIEDTNVRAIDFEKVKHTLKEHKTVSQNLLLEALS